jgi:WhiB family transcriptional regulator, redox-sensing transcriptional regulator
VASVTAIDGISPRSVIYGKFLAKALDRTEADEQYSAAPPFRPTPGKHEGRLDMMKSQAWREQGQCKGVDPEIFYPISDDDADEAKAICAECPVRLQCLEYALIARERDGIWGGCTERERRRIIRQRRRAA